MIGELCVKQSEGLRQRQNPTAKPGKFVEPQTRGLRISHTTLITTKPLDSKTIKQNLL